MKFKSFYRFFLSFLTLVFFILIIFENSIFIHAKIVGGSTPSNITIERYFAIDFSKNLTKGIFFGEINVLPATNVNASANYDGVSNASTFYINVSKDSNSEVNFCIRGDSNLTSEGLEIIGLGNQTFSNSTSTDSSNPDVSEEVSLTADYSSSSSLIPVGGTNYYRFWLDVPSGQPSGSYNNTISFKGVRAGFVC